MRCFIFGTPEGIRTPDLLVRSQTLYPTELPARTYHFFVPNYIIITAAKKQVFFENSSKIMIFCQRILSPSIIFIFMRTIKIKNKRGYYEQEE